MRRLVLAAVVAYLVLLAWSQIVRRSGPDPVPRQPSVTLASDPALPTGSGRPLTVAWREYGHDAGRAPAVVLHGSPGDASDLDAFARALARDRRVLVPDLPGSGHSTRRLTDYSYVAQAKRMGRWIETVGCSRVHLVGYSMGGGVAVTMTGSGDVGRGPSYESLTLVSSIGVQSMELFGRYRVNHAVHGAQLALLWLVAEGVPQFGVLDDAMVNVPYARTFFDSDQRPLAGRFAHLDLPTLIVHGRQDGLVSVAAAREHARLVPQAELHVLEGDHFLILQEPARLGRIVGGFLDRVERGVEPSRRDAAPERLRAALRPFDPATIPPVGPVGQLVLALTLALATLASEDAACIAAGALVAHGQIGFVAAASGCLAGIAASDAAIYALGRAGGHLIGGRRLAARLAARPGVHRAADWLRRRGPVALATSRFIPGTRVVTCFAAGAVGVRALPALAAIGAAALVWTPLAVALSFLATRWSLEFVPQRGVLAVGAAVVLPLVGRTGLRHLPRLRIPRRVAGWWLRLTRWEFWPPWVVYAPVILLVLPRALRATSLTAFTAANPGIPASGFVGESKTDILRALHDGGAPVAPFVALAAGQSPRTRRCRAREFIRRHGLPVVLKPDQGQRGSGVRILETGQEVDASVRSLRVDSVLQAFVDGPEFGIFYARRPADAVGRIVSLTAKRLPAVIGDGRRTLAQLISDDPRAVAMASTYEAANASRLADVPSQGQRVTLSWLGSHCRGAIFLDGAAFASPKLEAAVERAARAMPGFCFGRFDVRAENPQALADGRFTILELNGVTSEPTHVYDPACTLSCGLRTLAASWRLAFDIGEANAASGARIWPIRSLIGLSLAHLRFRAVRDDASRPRWVGVRRAHRGGAATP